VAAVASASGTATSITTSTFISPTNGATFVDPNQPFQWTTVASAQAYELWIGSTAGAHDVFHGSEIQATGQTVPDLPTATILYATIWTEVGGAWTSSGISFTTTSAALLTNPTNGETDVARNLTVQWTTVSNAQAYELYIGTTAGANNIYNGRQVQVTSQSISGLPANETLYARIWTELSGVWYHTDVSFSTAPAAILTSPLNGQTAVDPEQPFTWTAVSNGQAYELWVGTTLGGYDVFQGSEIQGTTQLVSNMPVGTTLFARLWTEVGGAWYPSDISFTTMPGALLTNPVLGASNVSRNITFQWTTVSNAQAYELYIGTTQGANNVYNGPQTQATSVAISNLPAAQLLYARIWTKVGGTWYHSDISFNTTPASILTNLNSGASNIPPGTITFTWQSMSNAQAYELWVGTSIGGNNIFEGNEVQATSQYIFSLPAATQLYARIWTEVAGVWYYSDAGFTTSPTAILSNPAPGQINFDPTQPFQWNAVSGAQAYELYIGSTQGASNIFNGHQIQATSELVEGLPPATLLYVRVWTEIASAWYYSDSTITTSPGAEFTFPNPGFTLAVDPGEAFQWTTGSGGQAYELWIGTTQGGHDVFQGNEIQTTSEIVPGLPPGAALWARIFTKVNGSWMNYSDVQFNTLSQASFIYPVDQKTAVNSSQPIQWAAVPGATAYALTIGSSPGASDVYQGGWTTATSVPVSLPSGVRLYATIMTQLGLSYTLASGAVGGTSYEHATFWTEQVPQTPVFTYPTNGQTNVDSGQPFKWGTVPGATSYYLNIGTTLGGSDLLSSGPIQTTERFVSGLPMNTLLYARAGANVGGQWYTTDISFTVTAATTGFASRLQSAFAEANTVNHMAGVVGDLYPNTPLYAEIYSRNRYPTADCGDFATVLLARDNDTNIGQSRVLNIAFNVGTLDTHEATELFNTDQQSWMIVDPNFDLSPVRTSDGGWATAQDMQNATLGQKWSAISYTFLGPQGSSQVSGYYLDYPLLYLNIQNEGSTYYKQPPNPIAPYLTAVPLPANATQQHVWIAETGGGEPAQLTVDGVAQSLATPGIEHSTSCFAAYDSISTTQSDVSLYYPNRYVFP
jgi:hypothetical protein